MIFPFAEFDDLATVLNEKGFDYRGFLDELENFAVTGVDSLFVYAKDRDLIFDEALSLLWRFYKYLPTQKFDEEQFEDFFMNYTIKNFFSLLDYIGGKCRQFEMRELCADSPYLFKF